MIEAAAKHLHEAFEARAQKRIHFHSYTQWELIGKECQQEFLLVAQSIKTAIDKHDTRDEQTAHLIAQYQHPDTPASHEWWAKRISETQL